MISVDTIDDLLPQTQCGECGYPGCRPYAEALAAGTASIDKCPPGGVSTLNALGRLMNQDITPFIASVEENMRPPSLAVIREAECIGCMKCIKACPVDAIIGSGKLMHSVLPDECTGCGLCVEPCPVDCIEMVSIPEATYDRQLARKRFHARDVRLLKNEQEHQQAYREKRRMVPLTDNELQDKKAKQDYILEALSRSQVKGSRRE